MSTHLDALLDDHAELRDVAAALREAADPDILRGLLQRLHGLLREHFAREEAVPSMQRVLSLPSGSSAESATRLIDEHRALLSTLGALVAKAEANGQRSAAAIARDVVAFMKRLQAHDARETELLGENVDAVQDTPSPDLLSRALETNLRRTAVDVVIPPEQAVLLEIVSDRHGVHESTRKLLREINHRYVGWPQTLEELHRRAMSDFAYYVGHERAGEAIGIPADVSGMRAAVVIEAVETHTRTGFAEVDLSQVPGMDPESLESLAASVIRVPVTHAKVFGWYDNEYGSYSNLLGDLAVHVDRTSD